MLASVRHSCHTITTLCRNWAHRESGAGSDLEIGCKRVALAIKKLKAQLTFSGHLVLVLPCFELPILQFHLVFGPFWSLFHNCLSTLSPLTLPLCHRETRDGLYSEGAFRAQDASCYVCVVPQYQRTNVLDSGYTVGDVR